MALPYSKERLPPRAFFAMAFTTLTPGSLLALWTRHLLPHINDSPSLVLAQARGQRASSAATVKSAPNSLFVTQSWPAAGLHAIRFPLLLHVLQGEADFRIGAAAAGRFDTVALPGGSFFLIPPGVPFSDGSHPHWERANLESAHSHLLWIHVFPTGLSFHVCQTRGSHHELSSSLFLKDARFMPLLELLLGELQAPAVGSGPLCELLLQTFLRRIEARLHSPDPWLCETPQTPGFARAAPSPVGGMALHQACSFIQGALQTPLTPAIVAAHAHVSVSHLGRLFRAEMEMSLMQFVTQTRIETAQGLLQTCDLPIGDIARLVGFPRPVHFTQVFTRIVGVSPLAFRRKSKME